VLLLEVEIKLPCSSKQPTEPIPRCAVLVVDRKGNEWLSRVLALCDQRYGKVPIPLNCISCDTCFRRISFTPPVSSRARAVHVRLSILSATKAVARHGHRHRSLHIVVLSASDLDLSPRRRTLHFHPPAHVVPPTPSLHNT